MIIKSENISLKEYNSFGIDIKAECVLQVSDPLELSSLIKEKGLFSKKHLILGKGSNILFTNNYNGLVILPQIKGIEVINENGKSITLKVGAGEDWDDFVDHTVKKGYSGIENLSLIPGTVGSSPIQNIGAYGVEVKDVIESVETIGISDSKAKVYKNNECNFDYRNSIFKSTLKGKVIITSVTFKLQKQYTPKLEYGRLDEEIKNYGKINLRNCRKAVISIRKSKLPDPDLIGNAGSFFKNPVLDSSFVISLQNKFPNLPVFDHSISTKKISAAWLIDQCGWKGKRIGNVGTYKTQALVIVNYGNATGKEIVNFSKQVQESVYKKFSIKLTPEVNIID